MNRPLRRDGYVKSVFLISVRMVWPHESPVATGPEAATRPAAVHRANFLLRLGHLRCEDAGARAGEMQRAVRR